MSVLICWSPYISLRSAKTRSQEAEFGEMAKTTRYMVSIFLALLVSYF